MFCLVRNAFYFFAVSMYVCVNPACVQATQSMDFDAAWIFMWWRLFSAVFFSSSFCYLLMCVCVLVITNRLSEWEQRPNYIRWLLFSSCCSFIDISLSFWIAFDASLTIIKKEVFFCRFSRQWILLFFVFSAFFFCFVFRWVIHHSIHSNCRMNVVFYVLQMQKLTEPINNYFTCCVAQFQW